MLAISSSQFLILNSSLGLFAWERAALPANPTTLTHSSWTSQHRKNADLHCIFIDQLQRQIRLNLSERLGSCRFDIDEKRREPLVRAVQKLI